jgi:hypothetical protein
MQENLFINKEHSIIGRRIAKSNIHINICKQYSVTSFIHIDRLSSTINIPFELKQNTNLIKPQIRERIETLKQAVYRTQSVFQR